MVFCSIYCDMKSYFHFHQITWIAQETLCMCCHSRQKSPCWQKNNWVTNIVNIHLSSVAFLTFSLSGTKIPKTHINVDELSFICLSWHCSSCDVTIGHVHIALLMLKTVYCAAWWCTFFFYHFCSNSEHLRTMPSFKDASWWSSHLNPNFSRSELTCLYSRAGFRNMPGLLLAETRPCYLYSWQHIRNDDAADFNVT